MDVTSRGGGQPAEHLLGAVVQLPLPEVRPNAHPPQESAGAEGSASADATARIIGNYLTSVRAANCRTYASINLTSMPILLIFVCPFGRPCDS